MSPTILLADDHVGLREALKALLERQGLSVVAEAADGQEAIEQAQAHSPDIAILDLAMPILTGLEASKVIMNTCPKTKVVLLTMHAENHQVLEALRLGIRGYILKTQAADDLVRAVIDVSEGAVYLSPDISATVVEAISTQGDASADPLTTRQKEVLHLVAEGKTTKEIAALLGVSAKTAESHRHRLMQALDIHDTAGLVRYAIRQGLIDP